MAALVGTQRYNWMGYHGTETEELNTALLRGGEGSSGDNFDYEHRQQVMSDIKERLHLIKRDLELIPEEELKAEEEERERRREARREREAEAKRQAEAERKAREEEEARAKVEQEKRAQEAALRQAEEEKRREEEERIAQANAARWRRLHDTDDDTDDDEEKNNILTNIPRSQEEIDSAVSTFGTAARTLLIEKDMGYVSYLDGTYHVTLSALQKHNKHHREGVVRALEGTNVELPDEEDFDTEDLATAQEHRTETRMKLDAIRCSDDPTYAARLRAGEKDEDDRPTVPMSEEDGDADQLQSRLDDAKQRINVLRRQYNDRATEVAKRINTARVSRVPEGGPCSPASHSGYDEPQPAAAEEGEEAPVAAPEGEGEEAAAADAPASAKSPGAEEYDAVQKPSAPAEEESMVPREAEEGEEAPAAAADDEAAAAAAGSSKKSTPKSGSKKSTPKSSPKNSSKHSSKKSSPKNEGEYPEEPPEKKPSKLSPKNAGSNKSSSKDEM